MLRAGGIVTFDRRSFLLSTAALGAGVSLAGCKQGPPAPKEPTSPSDGAPTADARAGFLDTLAAVAEQVVPTDDLGPGAKEAGVRSFLEKSLTDERLSHLVPLLRRAATFLDRAAQAEHKTASFAALPVDAQRDILVRLSSNQMRPNGFQGTAFLRIMVALTLEGLLGHPKHGGNQGEVVWKWLGYSEKGRASAHVEGKGT